MVARVLPLLLLATCLALLAVPTAQAVPSAADAASASDCNTVEIRQPLPGQTLPQVLIDPQGCVRETLRKAIGWSG